MSIWAVVTLPMAVLAWGVAPALIPRVHLHPGVMFWLLMIAGMVWQFLVSVILLRQELGRLTWAVLRQRLWLTAPSSPGTGRPDVRLWGWVLPCLLFSALAGPVFGDRLDTLMSVLLPGVHAPGYADLSTLGDPQFRGQWWLLGVALTSSLFNYLLGEELLFRGVLLPRMRGVFGKWDWVANAVLFGLYHLHKPWNLPSTIASGLAFSWPARRFRSTWMAFVVHGAEGVYILLLLGMIVGR